MNIVAKNCHRVWTISSISGVKIRTRTKGMEISTTIPNTQNNEDENHQSFSTFCTSRECFASFSLLCSVEQLKFWGKQIIKKKITIVEGGLGINITRADEKNTFECENEWTAFSGSVDGLKMETVLIGATENLSRRFSDFILSTNHQISLFEIRWSFSLTFNEFMFTFHHECRQGSEGFIYRTIITWGWNGNKEKITYHVGKILKEILKES